MPSDNDPTKLSFCRVRKSDRERFKPTISHSVFPSDSTAMIAPFVISQRDLSPKLTTCQNKRKDCTLIWSFFFQISLLFRGGNKRKQKCFVCSTSVSLEVQACNPRMSGWSTGERNRCWNYQLIAIPIVSGQLTVLVPSFSYLTRTVFSYQAHTV